MNSTSSPKLSGKRVLCVDPSLTATGLVVFEVTDCDLKCLHIETFSAKVKTMTGIRQRSEEQRLFSTKIDEVCRAYEISVICSEFPHGSQSNAAAVSLSMVTSVLTGYCVGRNLKLYFYSQFDSKMNFIGTQIDIKDLVVLTALKHYQKYGYIKPKTKKDSEATADAIAVFDLYLRNFHPVVWNVVHGRVSSI